MTRRPRLLLGTLTLPLLLGLGACGGSDEAPAVSSPAVTAVSTPAAADAAATTDAPEPAEPGIPVSLTIGDGPVWDLEALGVDADGFINPPSEIVQWYDSSPRPGDPGIAVIAGHVTYDGVPDVFADLDEVQVGDRVVVEDEHGTSWDYEVTEVRTADKDDVMVDQDVWGPSETSRLAIVTCDDTSVVEDGVHLSGNLVVEAEQVDD